MRKLIPVALASLLLIALAFAQTTRVGPLPSADSLAVNTRAGRTGETITQAAGGNNKERVRRGSCYWSCGTSAALPTTVSTTAPLVLYNPTSSGVVVYVSKVWGTYQSGTLGTGVLFHCVDTIATHAAPSGGTVTPVVPALVGNNNAAVAVCRVNATVTGPNVIAPFMGLPGGFTTTSIVALAPGADDLGDGVALLPGTNYQIQSSAAAGTSPLMSLAVFWEEQPLLNGSP